MTALLAFAAAFVAYLVVDVAASRLAGERSFSLPVGALVVGIVCAVLAQMAGPWVTVAAFGVLALVRAHEAWHSRRATQRDDPQR